MFTPDDRPEENQFFARNVEAIARGEGAAQVRWRRSRSISSPSETPPGGLPQAGETRFIFTNNHLGYAVTWYGLAAALAAVFGSVCLESAAREPRADPRLTPPGAAP